MKRINANCIVLIIIVFLMVSAKVYSQNENTATQSLKDALIKLETSSWEAWKNRDGKFFEGFLSGDHVEIGFSGVTNKESVVRSVGSPSCIVKGYKIDGFELKIIDQTTALLTYHAWQETTCNGKPVPTPVWVGSLYQKRNGKWLNVVYQQSQELSGGQGN